jgi:hypothetical protein
MSIATNAIVFRLVKETGWRPFIRIVICFLISFLLSPVTKSLAQQDDNTIAIPKILLQVTTEESRQLPTPSRYNPSNWTLPDYARTPFECVGDDTIGSYMMGLFKQQRGQLNASLVSQGFLYVTLPKQEENSLDILELTPSARDQLRTLLKLRLRDIEESKAALNWVFTLASIPGAITKRPLVWAVYLAGEATARLGAEDATKPNLADLAHDLQSSAQLYRSVVVVNSSSGSEYIRYLYAVKPNERQISILRVCYFARHER